MYECISRCELFTVHRNMPLEKKKFNFFEWHFFKIKSTLSVVIHFDAAVFFSCPKQPQTYMQNGTLSILTHVIKLVFVF